MKDIGDGMEQLIKKFSPLTEATYYILIALSEPLHGYGVIKKVEALTEGRISLAAGTLYGAFNTLQKNKLIQLMGVDPDNPRRKVYQLTEDGKSLIQYEVNRLYEMSVQGAKEIGVSL